MTRKIQTKSQFCETLGAEDPLAEKLCHLLAAEYGETRDRQGTVQEVFDRAIQRIEEEIIPLGDISPDEEKKLFAYKAWGLGFRLPWLFYDGDVNTGGDIDIRLEMMKRIGEIKLCARQRYANSDSDLISFQVVRGLMEYVKEALPIFSESPELDTLEAYRFGVGDCTENSTMLAMMMKVAGFKAGIADVEQDMFGDKVRHLSAAVEIGGRWLLADTVPPYDSFPTRHRSWRIISPMRTLDIKTENRNIAQSASLAEYLRRLIGSRPRH